MASRTLRAGHRLRSHRRHRHWDRRRLDRQLVAAPVGYPPWCRHRPRHHRRHYWRRDTSNHSQVRLQKGPMVSAERLTDDRRRGRVCAVVTNVYTLLGELDEALVTGTRALEIAVRLGDGGRRHGTTTY